MELYFDLETTGFSRQWDYIIEIAGILYNEKTKEIEDSFHEYIKPNKNIPQAVTELTGITNKMVQCCKSESEVMREFVEWVVGSNPDKIIGHNCKSFDLSFIKEKTKRYGLYWNDEIPVVDTLIIARELKKKNEIVVSNCKQTTLAQYFNIEYKAHSAIEDVAALIKINEKFKNIKKDKLGF